MIHRLALTLTLLLGLGQALTMPAAAAEPFATVDPLAPGLHLGYGTFAPVADERLPALDARIAEATKAGMDVTRVLVDWAELEPQAGRYDFSTLDRQLDRVPAGARVFLTLSVADVDRYSVPADLLVSKEQMAAPLSEPGVTGRYLALLDRILTRIAADFGLFALSVANEPDSLLVSRPAVETTALATFTRSVSAYAATWFPGLPVTLTISGGGLTHPPGFLSELIGSTDIAAFNWGCIDLSTFTASDPATIPDEIALLLAAAGDREIVVQELSCGSGYVGGDSFFGSSPEKQAAWFGAFFAAMAAEPRFRAAFVLDLVDWPKAWAKVYSNPLHAANMDASADRFEEFVRTWGLLGFDDLAPKPAWFTFLAALKANRQR